MYGIIGVTVILHTFYRSLTHICNVCGLCVYHASLRVRAAVRVVRGSSSGQFVKISNTHVEKTTTASLINDSVIGVRRVVISAVCRLE